MAAAQTPDPYKLLGVAHTATPAEVKKAWRKAARKHHPDLIEDPTQKKAAEKKMAQINQAYETLSDPAARRAYDAPPSHTAWQGANTPGGFGGFGSDLFGAGGAGGTQRIVFGEDEFEDLVGSVWRASQQRRRRLGVPLRGLVHGGQVTSGTTSYTIPAGTPLGSVVVGSDGESVLVEVRLPDDYRAERNGDLSLTVELWPSELISGTTRVVEPPDGDGRLRLTIKPGSQLSSRYHVPGRGLPTTNGRGELTVKLKLRFPWTPGTQVSEAAAALTQALENEANGGGA